MYNRYQQVTYDEYIWFSFIYGVLSKLKTSDTYIQHKHTYIDTIEHTTLLTYNKPINQSINHHI